MSGQSNAGVKQALVLLLAFQVLPLGWAASFPLSGLFTMKRPRYGEFVERTPKSAYHRFNRPSVRPVQNPSGNCRLRTDELLLASETNHGMDHIRLAVAWRCCSAKSLPWLQERQLSQAYCRTPWRDDSLFFERIREC